MNQSTPTLPGLLQLEKRERDALVAEHVMGWQWFERNLNDGESRKALYPPEKNGWFRANWSNTLYRPASEKTERFSDWDNACGRREDNSRHVAEWGVPHFSTEASADYSVLKHVRETWDKYWLCDFSEWLNNLFDMRPGVLPDPIQYQPGDYSIAALYVALSRASAQASETTMEGR